MLILERISCKCLFKELLAVEEGDVDTDADADDIDENPY